MVGFVRDKLDLCIHELAAEGFDWKKDTSWLGYGVALRVETALSSVSPELEKRRCKVPSYPTQKRGAIMLRVLEHGSAPEEKLSACGVLNCVLEVCDFGNRGLLKWWCLRNMN